MPVIYVGFKKKTAIEIKFSVEVPMYNIKIHSAVLEVIQDRHRQTDMAKVGGALISINFRWNRAEKNLSERNVKIEMEILYGV